MSRTLSWGILGTGLIAGVFANGVKQSQTGMLVAVGSRSQAAADTFLLPSPYQYALEADTVAAHLDEQQAPAMTWKDTLGNMKTLDQWRAAIGVDNQTSWPHASVMFDDFFEQGDTCFDTAYIYASGACEKMLGHWVKNRGIREQKHAGRMRIFGASNWSIERVEEANRWAVEHGMSGFSVMSGFLTVGRCTVSLESCIRSSSRRQGNRTEG